MIRQSLNYGAIEFSSVQSLSRVWLFAIPWITALQASLSITNSRSSLRLTFIESVMPSSHLILCHPLLLLPSIFSSIRVFSNESTLRMRWPKYWSFSFSISPSNEHPGLIYFRVDWLDLLAVQGTLKSLLQHHSSKASILRCSAFLIVHLSHPNMTTGKTKALTRWTFVGKVMSLLFNMLSRLVITFLPRRKCLLISWLQSPSAVILVIFLLISAMFRYSKNKENWASLLPGSFWSMPTRDQLPDRVHQSLSQAVRQQDNSVKLIFSLASSIIFQYPAKTQDQPSLKAGERYLVTNYKLQVLSLHWINCLLQSSLNPCQTKLSILSSINNNWKGSTFRKWRSRHLVPSLHGK